MAILIDKFARVLIQGITGRSGVQVTSELLNYGTKVVAGVTPGKGGQVVDTVPVFNSIQEAISKVGKIDVVMVYVPPYSAKDAVFEAINAKIPFIHIFVERIPILDTSKMLFEAKKQGIRILGPASVGIISPQEVKIGSIGGPDPNQVFAKGPIGVISRSGGMCSEIGLLLKKNNLGVSWAVGIGGDRIIGTDFADLLLELENDPETKASVIFGELGGTYEERVAEFVKSGQIKKPVVAFIAGEFTLSLPNDVQFGHAGAIIEGTRGMPDQKRKVLREAGVKVADNLDQIPELIKSMLK